MIALRGKVKRVSPGSPRSSPVPISTPPIITDADGKPQIPPTPPGSWTWTGLWAFDAVPDPPPGEEDLALIPPHKRPRPVPGSGSGVGVGGVGGSSSGSSGGSGGSTAQPRGFVYKFQEVVDPSTIRVPSLNDDDDAEDEEEEKRRREDEKQRKRAEAAAERRARAAAAPPKRRKGMCKIPNCPKTRQGNCKGMCRAHFQESLLNPEPAAVVAEKEKEEAQKSKEGAESSSDDKKSATDAKKVDAAAATAAPAPATGEAKAADSKLAGADGAAAATATATATTTSSTAAEVKDTTAATTSTASSKSDDTPKAAEESSKDGKEDSKAPSTPAPAPAPAPARAKKEVITFATPSDDGRPYTDASLTYPGQCPPSGRWTGYFENETRRKDRQTSRVPEVFYLFFNTTPAKDATAIFTDVTIEGEGDEEEIEEEKGVEKSMDEKKKDKTQVEKTEIDGTKDIDMDNANRSGTTATTVGSGSTIAPPSAESKNDTDEKKDGVHARKTEATAAAQKFKEGLLPSGHIHVRGCGTNQYGKWELVGGYDPVLGVLRGQRIYVNLASDEKSDKSRSSSQVSTPARSRSRSRSRGTSFADGGAVRTSSRKRQISWRKASAYETEAEKKAAAGSAKKRPRAMSEGAGKAAATNTALSPAGGKGAGPAGLSVSAAKAAAAAQAALGVGPAGVTTPRGTASGGKSQHIHRKPSTPRAPSAKKAAKGVPSVIAPPVATVKLPPAGDPKKAKWRAAHYFMYETIYDGEGSTKGSPNSVMGRPASPTGSVGTALSSPGGGPHAQFVVYEGELNNSLREGRGVCLYNNDLLYEGEWRRNKEHGKGILLTSDRSRVIYEGDWERGRMHGQGTYYYPTDSPFVDLITGAPTPMESPSAEAKDPRDSKGGIYTGDFKENARHGLGTYTLPDGSVYEGDWRENLPCGRGTFRWTDGSTYTGQWKNGKRHGQGVLNAYDGFSYDGMWVNNAMEGRGVAIYPKGQKYEGAWVGGKREGRGTILFTNGAVYEGRFRDDLMEGQGTLKMTRNAVVPKIENGGEEDSAEIKKQEDGDGDVVMKDVESKEAEEKEKEDWMIPIQFQSDISSIHQKAGFTEGGE